MLRNFFGFLWIGLQQTLFPSSLITSDINKDFNPIVSSICVYISWATQNSYFDPVTILQRSTLFGFKERPLRGCMYHAVLANIWFCPNCNCVILWFVGVNRAIIQNVCWHGMFTFLGVVNSWLREVFTNLSYQYHNRLVAVQECWCSVAALSRVMQL